MTRRLVAVVITLTRAWTRVYTCRLPPQLADARRAEIESDLWEMQHDPDLAPGSRAAATAATRLIRGMAHDLAWRRDSADPDEQFLVRRAVAVVAAIMLVVSLWSVSPLVMSDPDVTACDAAAPLPQFRAALLQEVVRCAGALFAAAR